MPAFVATLVRLSPSRALLLFILFCAACLSSCAAGKVEDVPIKFPNDDAGLKLQNIANFDASHVPREQDAAPSLDAGQEPIDVPSTSVDSAVSRDHGSLMVLVADAGRAKFDVPSLETTRPFDAGHSTPIDVPRPDIPTPSSDASSLPDQGQPDVGQRQDTSVVDTRDAGSTIDVRPLPTPELCNGRDDDGNGLIDELFECSVGRRGSTCVTTCGANGFQVCAANCRWNPVCQTYPEVCDDTIDNDCNGRIDCADPACQHLPRCQAAPPVDAGALVDAGRTDGCHDLLIRLDATRLPTCSSGRVIILYDSEGHPYESMPGEALAVVLCGRLRGALVVSTRCVGDYLLNWPGSPGRPSQEGGIASIMLDGNELADSESLLCLDRFSPTPGVRPSIPLEPFFYGRCP